MKEGGHSIHELFHGLEEVVMSDLTTQVFPEAFNRIELGRRGWQEDQFNGILMLSQESLQGTRWDERKIGPSDGTGDFIPSGKVGEIIR
jgi:hypothetical protein